MEIAALVFALASASVYIVDSVHRWRTTTNVIDGGAADTDFDAELRVAKRWALLPLVAALLALASAGCLLVGMQ